MSMKDFVILNKIGKLSRTTLKMFKFIGDGAYSEVYKVKRLSDGQIYALKKVR
jgi:serine/threonine protein kinase